MLAFSILLFMITFKFLRINLRILNDSYIFKSKFYMKFSTDLAYLDFLLTLILNNELQTYAEYLYVVDRVPLYQINGNLGNMITELLD